uniref:NADH-ubiquinone oxidoreductase chain 4 n=1 Tax=Varroa destructor TaxID=109461 RepID=Q8HEI0_VARDE|nr:NADH dehydrogenase subunit 4 [Varroa destructor]
MTYYNFFTNFFLGFILFIFFIMNMNNINLFMINNLFYIDEMSMMLIILSIWIILLMFLSMKYNKMLFTLFNILLITLILSFSISNLILFYIMFEMTIIPMLFFIMFWGYQMERFEASIYLLLYTIFGSLPLLLMILMLNNHYSLSMFFWTFLNIKLPNFEMMFLLLAFLIKMPIYGFHLWLPKAHVEAPIAGSMLLAGILLNLVDMVYIEFFMSINWMNIKLLEIFIWPLTIIGAIIISIMCITQIDIKMLIAYSSICHMSIVVGGLMSGNFWGQSGALLMMISHGLCSSSLFFMANIYYERFFTRNLLLLKGLMNIFPVLGFFMFLNCVINLGSPPTMNLLSEILLYGSIMKWNILNMPLLMILSFLSSFYSIYLFSITQHGKFIFHKAIFSPSIKEYNIIIFHLFPLFIYLFKMELFMFFYFKKLLLIKNF